MMTKTIKCITCPIGCDITVTAEGGTILETSGNECKRGEEYASNEFLAPKRILTSVVKAEDYRLPVVSVRTSKAIPKHLMFECMEILRGITAKAPFMPGDVLVSNVLGTDADIIITKR